VIILGSVSLAASSSSSSARGHRGEPVQLMHSMKIFSEMELGLDKGMQEEKINCENCLLSLFFV
jgi:hypothetical protein